MPVLVIDAPGFLVRKGVVGVGNLDKFLSSRVIASSILSVIIVAESGSDVFDERVLIGMVFLAEITIRFFQFSFCGLLVDS